jgi:Short-chain alcohol dehydrogenase of unknown specificity
VNLAFPKDEQEEVKFAINIETATAYRHFDEMLTMPEIGILDGIVIGRVDLSGSLGLSRNHINGEEVFGITKELAAKAKSRRLEVAIGGGVSADSLSFFRALPNGHLDRYETRKVIFSCPGALAQDCEKGILKAVGFELLWLKNKRTIIGAFRLKTTSAFKCLKNDTRMESRMPDYQYEAGTALITGASRGIGAAIAARLQGEGIRVLSPLSNELDLSSSVSIDRYLSTLTQPIDILINNAGINRLGSIDEISSTDFEDVIQINLLGHFRLTQAWSRA